MADRLDRRVAVGIESITMPPPKGKNDPKTGALLLANIRFHLFLQIFAEILKILKGYDLIPQKLHDDEIHV